MLYPLGEENDPLSLKEAIVGLEPQQVLEAIVNAIENVFGPDSAALVFKTLKIVYKLDREAIPSNIGQFDELLDSVFGTASKPLRKRIMSELERKRHGSSSTS